MVTDALAVRLADSLAAVVCALRRNLRTMVATPGHELDSKELRKEIVNHGSSWAALCLALVERPKSLNELLEIAEIHELTPHLKRMAFNACVDGYTVFSDAQRRGKL